MYRVLIIIALLMSFDQKGIAQPAWTRADSLTYQLYLDGKWKELLNESDRFLREGMDFYYLRVRAGVAAYQLKKYRMAASHFEMARKANDNDDFVNYWYYYALLMGSRTDEAQVLANSFSSAMLKENRIKPPSKVHTVVLETQLTGNNQFGALKDEIISSGDSYLGYRNLLNQQLYKGLGIGHQISKRVNAFHGFSHLSAKRTQMFQSALTGINLQQDNSTSQFQYYFQASVVLPHGWKINGSATLLWGEAQTHWLSGPDNNQPQLNQFSYPFSDLVATAAIAKEMRILRPKLSLTLGDINGLTQIQANSQLTVYPLANPNIFLISELTFHSDEAYPETKTVFAQKLGIKTGPVWLTGEVATGQMQNFSTADGYVVYNMPETINKQYGMSLFVPLLKYRFGLTARYLWTDKSGFTYNYENTTDYLAVPFHFNENNFLISLRWHL